jgi:two-component system sensor histidine kinase DesK
MSGRPDDEPLLAGDPLCEERRLPWGPVFGHPGRVAGLIGLGYLAYPVSELLGSDASVLHKVVALLGGAVAAGMVLAVLFDLNHRDGDDPDRPLTPGEVYRYMGVLAAIDAALILFDRSEWGSVLSIFVVAFGAIGLGGVRGAAVVLGFTAVSYGLMVAGGASSSTAAGQSVPMISIGLALMAFGEIMRTNRELRVARAEVARLAVADERRRFARDVHDLLGHSLSVIALKSQVASRLLERDPGRAAREIAEIEDVARRALSDVRETVTGYRRPTIPAELAAARAALESAGVHVDVRTTRMALDAEDEAVLAWALREGATNVVRHAGARRVRVRLEADGRGARLEIADDGRGMAAGGSDAAGNGHGAGNGLRGLAERVAARDGRLESGPTRDGGFRLAVSLPGEART